MILGDFHMLFNEEKEKLGSYYKQCILCQCYINVGSKNRQNVIHLKVTIKVILGPLDKKAQNLGDDC